MAPGDVINFRQGTPDIQIYFLVGAHTAGDFEVYLPQQKIMFTGDFLSESGQFLCDGRDGSILQCPSTLRRVQAIDIDLVIPGNGNSFHGKKGLAEAIAKPTTLTIKYWRATRKANISTRSLLISKRPRRLRPAARSD